VITEGLPAGGEPRPGDNRPSRAGNREACNTVVEDEVTCVVWWASNPGASLTRSRRHRIRSNDVERWSEIEA